MAEAETGAPGPSLPGPALPETAPVPVPEIEEREMLLTSLKQKLSSLPSIPSASSPSSSSSNDVTERYYQLYFEIIQLCYEFQRYEEALSHLTTLKEIHSNLISSPSSSSSSSSPHDCQDLEWQILLFDYLILMKLFQLHEAEKIGIHLLMRRLELDQRDSEEGMKLLILLKELYSLLCRKSRVEYLEELVKYIEENLQNHLPTYVTLQFLNDIATDESSASLQSNCYHQSHDHHDHHHDPNQLFQFIIKFSKQHLSSSDITTTRYMNNYAEYLRQVGRYEEAIQIHLEIFHIRENLTQLKVIDPLFLAESCNNLGLSYSALRDYSSAEFHILKALEIRKEKFASDLNRPLLASSYHHLAELYRDMSQPLQAIECHEKVIEIYSNLYGTNHPNVMNAKGNMGITYLHFATASQSVGNYLIETARNHLIQDLKYSHDHPWVVKYSSEINLAEANQCFLRKEYKIALEKYDLILTEKQRHHESQEVISRIFRKYFEVMYCYGVELLEVFGDIQQAKEILEICARESQTYFQRDEKFSYEVLLMTAACHRMSGEITLSIEVLENILAQFPSNFGKFHPVVAKIYRGLALCYADNSNYSLATDFLEQVGNLFLLSFHFEARALRSWNRFLAMEQLIISPIKFRISYSMLTY